MERDSAGSGEYEEIDEIQQDDSHDDFEYTESMEHGPPMVPRAVCSQQLVQRPNDSNGILDTFTPPPAAESAAASQDPDGGYAKAYELLDHDQREALIPESFSSASDDSSLSDSEKVFKEIRQKFPSQGEPSAEDDDKLFIIGTLEDDRPPLSFKSSVRSRSGAMSEGTAIPKDDEMDRESQGAGHLEEHGIYQGLVMTDEQRRQLGILPEAIYMTTNLENWFDNFAANEPHPSTTQEESRPIPAPIKPTAERRHSDDQHMNHTPRSVKPYYRDCIIRAPPLPPVDSRATRAERKAHAVVDQLLKSEASFLSSLKIAMEIYMKPLEELARGPNSILDREQVKTLFGPVADIAHHHELFYSALLSRTLDWHIQQKIGDIFMSSMHNKALMKHYTSYVNNFAVAMYILEHSIQKKPRFVEFLKQKYMRSKTSLSLQGLLLKPIQRFPQYILFLTDLLKYTSPRHPDRITLQMALAHLEGIAGYLNEAKRLREQKEVVNNLSTAVTRLPFRLTDSQQRWLYRQDVVTKLFLKDGGGVRTKHRCLLLFNNMVICAAAKRKRKSPKHELESTTGSREFKGTVDTSYVCKWFAPLSQVQIEEPDYNSDVWDKALVRGGGGSFEDDHQFQSYKNYQQLKQRYRAAGKDFEILTRIANLIFMLSEEYQGLTTEGVSNHIRVLQRKIAKLKEQIKAYQQGRIDVSIPSRDGTKSIHHTYRFLSEKVKEEWISAVRCAKLRLAPSNKCAWVTGEDVEDEDEIVSLTHKLPLVVESSRLNSINSSASVMCAAKVGQSTAWLAGGGSSFAQVTVVECVTPTPLVLECFKVDSSRIMDILYVPPAAATQSEATLTATMKRISMRSTLKGAAGSLTSIPPHLATVWLGGQCGKLSIYSAESVSDGTKKCLATVKFNDAITSLCYYHDQVYLSTAEGKMHIFRRSGLHGWDLVNRRVVEVTSDENIAICCSCRIVNKLWLGTGGSCHIFNLQTLKVECSLAMNGHEHATVSHMVCWGEGVWVSYRKTSTLELWHTVTKKPLQDINIKDTITGILSVHHLEPPKVKVPEFVHVTALMASSGFLWIGTSMGLILIYRIPHLEGIPIVSGKPYLAMDGHRGAVRVLLPIKTKATITSSRVGQFLSDEQSRRASSAYDEEESKGMMKLAAMMEAEEGEEGMAGLLVDREEDEGREGGNGGSDGGTLKHATGQSSINNVPALEENGAERDKSLTPPFRLSPPAKAEDELTLHNGAEADHQPPEEQDEQVKPVSEEKEQNKANEVTKAVEEKEDDQVANGDGEDHLNGNAEVPVEKLVGEDKEEEPPPYEFGDANEDEEIFGIVNENGREREGENLSNGRILEFGIYSAPVELDLRPRQPKKPAKKVKEEGIYDLPREILPPEMLNKLPANYEAPSELNDAGPVTTRGGLFSPEFATGVGPSSFTLPGKEMDSKLGAIFVLTSGRGLINLRPGVRTQVLFPTAAANSSTDHDNNSEEGCMISYEVEISQ